MNIWKKLLALALCLSMVALVGCQSIAETADATAAPEETPVATVTNPELTDESVIATVNGKNVTWADAQPWYNSVVSQYSSSYDFS